jgi:hypothetical protein
MRAESAQIIKADRAQPQETRKRREALKARDNYAHMTIDNRILVFCHAPSAHFLLA